MINLNNISAELKKDLQSILFIADLHHGHTKIIDICNRPVYIEYDGIKDLKLNKEYKNLLDKAHTEWLVKDVINKWVNKNDTIFFIGDLSMANKVEAEKFIDRLNGNKFLIIGNHDKNIQNSTRFTQITIRKNFTYSKFGLNIHIVLDHFPLASWDRKHFNSWHLYGHVHGRFKNNGLSFDVGIDNPELKEITGGIYRPLNLLEIIEIMNKKENNGK